ncbi:helix-turn-helix transcriptional regulator [Candidatus Gottesmanbacteria bacterium]|nr:helix-turn-helix transcriptional regulator [Candidatus Gottesmanbacteria bacterium]
MEEAKITQKDIQLGKRIRRFRKKADLTQEKLAEKVHVSTTHIGLVETGKRRVSLKTLQRIASALGVKVRELLPF